MRVWPAAMLAIALVACGIPIEAEPEPLDVEVPSPSDEAEPIPGDLAAVSMYLVRNDQLVHVTRDLPSPPSPAIIFESLLEGSPTRRNGPISALRFHRGPGSSRSPRTGHSSNST